MNIFYLDHDPRKAAQYQCDAHVVKMILESAQLLSTCYPDQRYYKHTHMNHPCALWVRESQENFSWLFHHAKSLCREYTNRYNKFHKSEEIIHQIDNDFPTIERVSKTPVRLAMPDEFKVSDDPVECYRAYYRHKAKTLPRFNYTNREVPHWLQTI